MPSWPFAILDLLIGVAGWYYLFYSRAAHRLGALEQGGVNQLRVMLRRLNGGAMLLLAVLLYIATRGIDPLQRPRQFVFAWLGVLILLLFVVGLALADIRLTYKLRLKKRSGDSR